MKIISVEAESKTYSIFTGSGILNNAKEEISRVYSGSRLAVITDETVYSLYGNKLMQVLSDYDLNFIVVKPGENSKSLNTLTKVYSQLISDGITRSDMIVAFGGGVVGDLAGFVASTYMRGMSYVQIPTTLLAQIDSSIGGKTAVNLPEGKNLVGTFWQPEAVIVDTDVLSTLPEKVLLDGMGEVIKYACIEDAEFFSRLEAISFPNGMMEAAEDIIHTCCSIKSRIVAEDERDTGLRAKLNFGHTLAHAIEKCCSFSTYTHGHAVAIGMRYMAELGERLGITVTGTKTRLKSLTDSFCIDTNLPDVDMNDIRDSIIHDKKNMSGSLGLVMLSSIGSSFIKQISIDMLPEYFC